MSEQITVEVFNHLVELAALQLDAEQAEYLRQQLNNQLKAIHELETIPIWMRISPSVCTVCLMKNAGSAKPREDVWQKYPDPEAILEQAPQVEDRYIVVPDIPHTTLK